ncbi:MAG TPA: hypothetical protein VF808_07125 [Ktedonobacterales bacterium]
MNRILSAAKATYNFFSGDAITLVATVIAFGITWILARQVKAPGVVVGILFLLIIIGGLVTTLGREIAGRPRVRS